MKKLSLFLVSFLICTLSYAQDGPAKRTEEYCELRSVYKLLKRTTVINVDYGNGVERLKDPSGKTMEFVSSVGAINFMNSMGWELVGTRISVNDGDSVTYYVMKRKAAN